MIPYRDDNPTRSFPFFTLLLMAANITAFVFFRLQGERGFEAAVWQLGMIPAEIFSGTNLADSPGLSPYLTLFTSMFMHGGLLHLGGNMLYLWIFGNNVEDFLGHFRFGFFYFACGLVAAATQLVFSAHSAIPMVGASGAVAGVLGAYFVLWPRARIHTLAFFFIFVTTMRVPAGFLLAFWIVLQVLNGLPALGATGGGVAYFAHIGGFVAGYFWVRGKRRKRRIQARWLD